MKNLEKNCQYIFIQAGRASEIFLHKGGDMCFNKTGEREKTEFIIPQDIYISSNEELKAGDWCMFYNQPSKVIEINDGSAKIETTTITSKYDAELINRIKGNNIIKEGEPGKMIHSFNIKQLPKIIATTNGHILINQFTQRANSVAMISQSDIEYIISLYNQKNKSAVDAQKLATEWAFCFPGQQSDEEYSSKVEGFFQGYIKASADKKWTDDDMKKCFEAARESKYAENAFRPELGWENDCEDKYNEFGDYFSTINTANNIIRVEYDSYFNTGLDCEIPTTPKLEDGNIIIIRK